MNIFLGQRLRRGEPERKREWTSATGTEREWRGARVERRL